MLVHARCVSKSVYKEAFMHMRLFYVPVNNFSFMSERFPVFLGKTSILRSGKNVLLEDTTQSLRWWGSRTSNPSIPSLTLYQQSHCQGSYRQDCVKLKDFSRTSKRLSYCFQGLKLKKNTDLHVKILLRKS